jgi:hypothetical protein
MNPTPMGALAVVDDYRINESGIYVRAHAVILLNGCKEPPCRPLVFIANNPENVNDEILTKFLDKYVSKYYDLYTTEKYWDINSDVLLSLKHKFISKGVYDAPVEMQGKVSTYLLLAFEQAEKAAEEGLAGILRNDKLMKSIRRQ